MSKIKGIYAAGMSVFNDDLSLNIAQDYKSCRKNNRSWVAMVLLFLEALGKHNLYLVSEKISSLK